jgi:hypothetical protein
MLVTGVATWCLVESVEWTNSNKNLTVFFDSSDLLKNIKTAQTQ